MTEGKESSIVEVQHPIRANAPQLPDYVSDLNTWEETVDKEDAARKRATKTSAAARETPPPRTARVIYLHGENGAANGKQSDAHTLDKTYKRWEKFDVDAALKEADEGGGSKQENHKVSRSAKMSPVSFSVDAKSKELAAPASAKSREEKEKEEGNAYYKRGHYVAAIKSYTRCLGYNPNNAVVLSNRAMAYLKNREFDNAEDDCTLALKADQTHVKSYSRRGTARNSLGKHRLALLDFYRAAMLDPKSRQIQAQLQSTRELIRTAIKCSPKRTEFSIEVVGERSLINHTSERDRGGSENEEILGPQQLKKRSSCTKQTSSPQQETASSPLPLDATSLRETHTKKKMKSLIVLPRLPKKAPATSYEFGRVWKTLALRGDAEQKNRLLKLRADYLLMFDPPTLCSIFKTAIEADVLCEIFHVLRCAVLPISETNTSIPTGTASFVLAFISELTKVPRFNMTVMLLSDSEREDVVWMIQYLEALVKESKEIEEHEAANLRKLYKLP